MKKLGVSHCGSGSSMEIGNFHLLDSLISSTNGRRHTCRKAWTEKQMEKALQAVNEMTVREAAAHAIWCAYVNQFFMTTLVGRCSWCRPTKYHVLRVSLTHSSATSHSHSCTHQNRLYLTHLPCDHANKITRTAVPILR